MGATLKRAAYCALFFKALTPFTSKCRLARFHPISRCFRGFPGVFDSSVLRCSTSEEHKQRPECCWFLIRRITPLPAAFKTSVITAKAGYLIKAGIRQPSEILLLAFARDAAAEMSERIEARSGEPVETRTFHALAFDIISQVEGGKPALAAHATDNTAFLDLIKRILIEVVGQASLVSMIIFHWFMSARLEGKSEWDFKRRHDFYNNLEKEDLRTLQRRVIIGDRKRLERAKGELGILAEHEKWGWEIKEKEHEHSLLSTGVDG
ncbi:UvrD-helicase domain-containing protein [Ruegeria sp. MALMAid1280]|uniref:UvrD-helicase domain-containing protein n=1 Tax=Ruegeria sp. MALMAid1280 TaxID=3411634 RepID=UPI003B9F5FD9